MLARLILGSFFLFTFADSRASPQPDLSIFGPTFGTDCGTSVAVGDFNGDGHPDIAVLCEEGFYPYVDLTIYLVWGANSTFPAIVDLAAANLSRSKLLLFDQPSGFGLDQLDIVDLNADGRDDLVLSVPYSGTGALKVIWGAESFPEEANLNEGEVAVMDVVWRVNDNDLFGLATTAGDLDDDGFQDLIVSAPNANIVFIIHGAANFPALFTIPGAAGSVTAIQETVVGWSTGIDLDSGDIDQDGADDILIGSFGDASSDDDYTGKATLILGPDLVRGSTFFLYKHQSNTTRFLSQDPRDAIGSGVAIADVDGDSFLDVVLAAKYTAYGGDTGCGAAHVVFDQWNWDDLVFIDSGETPVTSIWGYGYDDQYGEPLACDDLSGDLYADVVLSSEARRVVSVLGAADLPGSIELQTYDPNLAYVSDQIGDYFGRTIWIDDISRDAIGDLLICAKWYSGLGRSSSGAVFAYYGERVTAIDDNPASARAPAARVLNYPNPFSNSTTITMTRARSSDQWIDIFDVAGRRVASLPLVGGADRASATWNGTDAVGNALASGVYFAKPRGETRFVGGRLLIIR